MGQVTKRVLTNCTPILSKYPFVSTGPWLVHGGPSPGTLVGPVMQLGYIPLNNEMDP